MIVILEGPDGSGKTTLAKTLQERYGLLYRHEGPPPEDVAPLTYYCDILEEHRHDNIVFDRFALGERVYGPILRHGDRIGELGWYTFVSYAQSLGVVQVVCLPPPDACHSVWASGRSEMLKSDREFFMSYAAFAYFAGDAAQLRYDWTRQPLSYLLTRLSADESE
jgi:energy-coupling factor transporter ATP-binding protein EcfA2